MRRIFLMTTEVFGTSDMPLVVCVATSEMESTTSMPEVTVPNAQ